jgi:hypothetical protein
MTKTSTATLLLSICLSLAAGQGAIAQSSGSRSMNISEAVTGRLTVEGIGTCGASRIGANLILTAAHCVQEARSYNPVAPGRITFTPDDADGKGFVARDVATHPDFYIEEDITGGDIAKDVALIRLTEFIDGDYETMAPLDTDSDFLVLLPVADSPMAAEACDASFRKDGAISLKCERDFGVSGSPIFDMINGERRIVGVVSAKAKTSQGAITLGAAPWAVFRDLTWLVKDRGVPTID